MYAIRSYYVWSLVAIIAAIPCALWYVAVLPEQAQQLVTRKSPTVALALQYGLSAVILLLVLTLVATILRPTLNNRPVALAAILCAFVLLGSFEWTREAARRPYVINEVIYSNSIFKKELTTLDDKGVITSYSIHYTKLYEYVLGDIGRSMGTFLKLLHYPFPVLGRVDSHGAERQQLVFSVAEQGADSVIGEDKHA